MSQTALSIRWYAVYLLLLGVALATVPDRMLAVFAFPGTTEVWIRVAGILVLNNGITFWIMAKSESSVFFRTTVITRVLVPLSFVLFVLLGFAGPALIAIGTIDLAGAVWTFVTLADRRPTT